MNRFITLIAAMLVAFAVTATDYTVTRKSPKGAVWTQNMDSENQETLISGYVKKSPLTKESEEKEYITLHVKFVYPDNLVPEFAAYDENGFGSNVWYEGEDEMDLEIPLNWIYEGDNILVGSFRPVDKSTESHVDNRYLVFVDLPELTDGTEVVFDANTIDRTFTFEFLNKEGNPYTLKHHIYDTTTKESTFDGDGDLEFGSGEIWIGGTNVLMKGSMMFFLRDRSYSDGRPDSKLLTPPTIRTNALPEGIVVNATLMGENSGGTEVILIATPNTTMGGTLRNNSEEYVDNSFKMVGTPNGGRSEMLSVGITLTCNGWQNIANNLNYDNALDNEKGLATINLSTCIPVSENPGVGIQYEATLNLTDLTSGGLISSPIILPNHSEGVLSYLQPNSTFGGNQNLDNNLYFRSFDNWDHPSIFTRCNPYMPSYVSDYAGILGNCCPAFVSLGTWPEINGQFPVDFKDFIFDYGFLTASYTGRSGEAMTADAYQSVITPENQGDYQIYDFWMDNVLVDGKIKGYNSAQIGCNFNLVDWVPPTLQTIFFTNQTGTVTDRFAASDEATVTLYAGDFEYAYNEAITEDMMAVKPLDDITVEYSPYQAEDYSELAVIENADKFWMPGFGYCYEGSLAQVTKASVNGWFDVRVSIKDINGNWQCQTISPAFYIGELSSIDSVELPKGDFHVVNGRIVSEDCGDIEVYTIDGCRVSNVSLTPGIYVARAKGTTRKVLVQ